MGCPALAFGYMMVEEEDTMMPMKEVMAKPRGMVISWGRKASLGLFAKRVKSGSVDAFSIVSTP